MTILVSRRKHSVKKESNVIGTILIFDLNRSILIPVDEVK